MPKVLHAADIHLGVPFRQFKIKGKELREGAKRTFSNIIKVAQDENIDLVIFAGDVADSNRLSPAMVQFITSELSKLRVPVVILPGTHDCFNKESLYRRLEWSSLNNINIFTEDEGQSLYLPSLSLAIHGKPNTSNRDVISPLKGLTPADNARWNIAVAHGSLQITGKSAQDDYPIDFKEIENCGMDYLALGHWHSFLGDIKQGKTLASYSGSATTLGFEEDSGTVNLVEFSDEGVKVTRKEVGYHRWISVECGIRDLEARLEGLKHPLTLLRVKISDKVASNTDVEHLLEKYNNSFFALSIEHNQEGEKSFQIDIMDFPETTVAGQFIRLAQSKIAESEPEQQEFWEGVMKRGCKILLTGEVDRC